MPQSSGTHKTRAPHERLAGERGARAVAEEGAQGTGNGAGTGTAAWRADSRRLRNGLISLAVFFGLVVGLLLGVPGLFRDAAERIGDANLSWVVAGVVLELLSCAAYVVLFELVFARLRKRLASRLSLSELAMNSVVSAGGIGGFALGAWVLRTGGAPLKRIAERTLVLYLLTSAVNVIVVAVLGVLMGLGVIAGSTNPLLTFLPAGAAIAAIAATLGLAAWGRSALRREQLHRGRWAVLVAVLSEGVEDVLRMLREHDWRLWGAVGYWLFDNLVLLACFYAYGHTPAVGAVLMAYLVGMLANSLPIPGGFGSVEAALVGMLLAYGERPASLVLAAVLTYRAIALWVPSIVGTAAFWSMRSEIGQPLVAQPEAGMAKR
jgi:uncharacterized membrane protein YbhN (UPF0104 family)